jgi:hypothetical protein
MLKVKLMLDSGAFSAWTRGEKIDLEEYMKFIRDNADLVETYINLDVIPGQRGVRPTVGEVDWAAAASLDNYKAMRAAGLHPIPVFHFGEAFIWLERLMETGADYICLGGTVGRRFSDKRDFFDKSFTILTNGRGEPLVKVHGLGVSEGRFVSRYPWQSVDSTSWAIAPIYGMILVPGVAENKFSSQIYVANGRLSPQADARRFERLPAGVQEHILRFVAEQNLTMTDLRNDVYARTITFISTLLLMRPAGRFTGRGGSFLVGSKHVSGAPVNTDFRMIFASNLSHRQGWLLVRCGADNRLLSYADLKRSGGALREYVEQGVVGALKTWPDSTDRAKVNWRSMSYHEDRRRRLVARIGESEDAEV